MGTLQHQAPFLLYTILFPRAALAHQRPELVDPCAIASPFPLDTMSSGPLGLWGCGEEMGVQEALAGPSYRALHRTQLQSCASGTVPSGKTPGLVHGPIHHAYPGPFGGLAFLSTPKG